MEKVIVLTLFFTIFFTAISALDIEARPCIPEIEICDVIDPGGGTPKYTCDDDVSQWMGILENSSETCTMDTSETYSRDEFYMYITEDASLTVWGLSEGEIYAELYKHPDYTNPISSFKVNSTEEKYLSNDYSYFSNLGDESNQEGFFFEFSVKDGEEYKIIIEHDYTTTQPEFEYTINALNKDCDCVYDEQYYMQDQSYYGIENIYSKVTDYNIDYSISASAEMYRDEIERSINEYDALDLVSFNEETNHLEVIFDVRINLELFGGAFGIHIPNPVGEANELVLNGAYDFTYYRVYSIFAHELSHALGINMDSHELSPKHAHFTSTSITLWETEYGLFGPQYDSLDYIDIVNAELYSVSRSGSPSFHSLGKCNKSIYLYLWEEGICDN